MTRTYLATNNYIADSMMKLPPCFLHRAGMRSK